MHGYGIQGKVFNAAVAFEDGAKLEDRTGGGFMEVTAVEMDELEERNVHKMV